MTSISRILRSTRALWPLYLGVLTASIITALLALASPFILREATDTIVAALTDQGAVAELSTTIVLLAVALFAADFATTVVRNVGGFIGDVLAARMRQILSTRYFSKLLSLPQQFFDRTSTGTIIARLDRSITSVSQFTASFSNNFFPLIVTAIAVLGVTAFYYWPITVLLVLVFPVYLWLTTLTSKHWQSIEADKNAEIDAASGRFNEVIGQVKATKSFVGEVRELGLFARRFARTVALTRRQSSWWHSMDILRGGAMNLIFLAIYVLIFYRTLHGYFSPGDMVMLLQLVTMAKQPITMLSWIVDISQRAIAGSRDYFAILDETPEKSADPQLIAATTTAGMPELIQPHPVPLEPIPGRPVIELDDVSFSYVEGEEVLSKVSFAAQRGETIGLIGESGGGKSTIVNLILGLYQPDSGRLSVCGRELTELTSEQLRASVGVVFQDPGLFSGTIRENIVYGRPDASDEAMKDMATRAGADSFISDFTEGYDTVIGERGLRLSGGQKQRIAVARAMLKDAPVLVLDEATSALDNRSEKIVQAGLDELMAGRTTVVIAHRLSTIASVDKLITIEKGEVKEMGTPEHLATTGGIYSQLLALTDSTAESDRRRLADFGITPPHHPDSQED